MSKRITTIQFTHAELAAMLEVAKAADAAGHPITGPAKWAFDRITARWTEMVEEAHEEGMADTEAT